MLHEIHHDSSSSDDDETTTTTTMVDDNKNELWYSYNELKEMKLNIKRVLQKLQENDNTYTDNLYN